jgi:AcrR family transcriptional regulator
MSVNVGASEQLNPGSTKLGRVQDTSGRKAEIYQAAERLFSRQGYHATTMRHLAAALGIEGGSLYSHISGKYELLRTIVLRASEQFREAAREVLAAGGRPSEQLHRLMQRHVAIVVESIDRAVIYHHEWQHLEDEDRALLKRHRDEYESAFRQIICAGMTCGEFVARDERLASISVLSLLNWTYQWYRPDGPLTADALANHFYTTIMCGLGPHECTSHEEGA